MRKRARQTSAKSRRKVKIREDLISEVPDDILIDIISRLTVREAARTCVLSSRWKNLWTSITNLDFEPPKSILVASKTVAERKVERAKYIDWVNTVLGLHGSSRVNEFRIRFDLIDCNGSYITDWIYAAMLKNVQKFELNLRQAWYRKMSIDERYIFPQECYNRLIENSGGLFRIKSLRSLCFFGVNITGKILQFFIHNCPLDRLSVAESHHLGRLKVVGSSITLKYLEIFKCIAEEIEISAPSLLSFKYEGRKIKLNIENVPQLLDLSIGWESSRLEKRHVTEQLVSYFPQLTNLELGFYLDEIHRELSQRALPNLRHLVIDFQPCNHEGILLLISIIDACPLLQMLGLKLAHYSHADESEIHQIPKHPLRHLKVLELFVFRENETDIEIVSSLLEDATMLEKVIVKSSTGKTAKIARKCSKLLRPKLPKGAKLIFLKM